MQGLYTPPATKEEFSTLVKRIEDKLGYRSPILYAIGREVKTENETLASVRYPVVNGPKQNAGTAAILQHVLGRAIDSEAPVITVMPTWDEIHTILSYFASFEGDGALHPNIEALRAAADVIGAPTEKTEQVVVTFIYGDVPPESVYDATLKLYALSLRLFKPNTLNLSRIFAVLPNVVWIGDCPHDEEEIDAMLLDMAFDDSGESALIYPHMADKFPLYVHRINALKMKVRITDYHKVRLGAYLGSGTTLMPGASYVNFNAGTEGESMVEGRISSSVFVGDGSDVGGGASILGVLSGGNTEPITIGRNCLLEANSVTGTSVGDGVIVSAGLALLAGTTVRVRAKNHKDFGRTVRARLLSNVNGVTFRRSDDDGVIEMVVTRRNEEFMKKLEEKQNILNAELHQN